MEAQPLRVHDAHGTFLSHFSLSLQRRIIAGSVTIRESRDKKTDRLHSAHAIAPCERFHSRSLYLVELAALPRPESGMAESFQALINRYLHQVCIVGELVSNRRR
jgi:hypothetical protein